VSAGHTRAELARKVAAADLGEEVAQRGREPVVVVVVHRDGDRRLQQLDEIGSLPGVHRHGEPEDLRAAQVRDHDVQRPAPLQHLTEERPVERVAADVAAPGDVRPGDSAADQLEHAAHHLRQQPRQRARPVHAGDRGDPQGVGAPGELVGLPGLEVGGCGEPAIGQALRRLGRGDHRRLLGQRPGCDPVPVVTVHVREHDPVQRR
jgi:hypothetical protein